MSTAFNIISPSGLKGSNSQMYFQADMHIYLQKKKKKKKHFHLIIIHLLSDFKALKKKKKKVNENPSLWNYMYQLPVIKS